MAKVWEWMKGMEKQLRRGYISLAIFMLVLSITLVVQPKIPIQTILIALAITVMIIGQAKLQDLVAGVILHPIMAMTAGFLIAGAMGLAGGFDVLLTLLEGLANWQIGGFVVLGYIGVGVILVNIPTIMPMPCGRILAAALIPGVYKYGEALALSYQIDPNASDIGEAARGLLIISSLLSAFIVNAAASCGPSPLGGIGGIGEGNMGVEIGSSGKSQATGIIIATGITALVIALIVAPIPG